MKNELRAKGMMFSQGLTDSDLQKIEKIYEITFPKSLREFYRDGVPFSENEYEFPLWSDYSEINISKIKQRIQAPKEWLLHSLKSDFDYWIPKWGEKPKFPEDVEKAFIKVAQTAPKLIPIYSHRYMPMLDNVGDPPVISAVGFDIIYYGSDLEDYLRHEFIELTKYIRNKEYMYIPFWSDIFNYNIKTAAENYNEGIKKKIITNEKYKTPEDFI